MAAMPRICSISAADLAFAIWSRSLAKMAADDVAALMRDDADHLVGRLGGHQRAGMDEHVVAVHHEGVEAAVVDDVDLDALRAEAGSVEDGLGVSADQRLCFGVADDARRPPPWSC